MISKMEKVLLVGPKIVANKVVRLLQESGVVHLRKEKKFDRYAPQETEKKVLNDLEKELSSVEIILSHLPQPLKTKNNENENLISDIYEQVRSKTHLRTQLHDELEVLRAYYPALSSLSPLLKMLEKSQNYECLGFILSNPTAKHIDHIKTALQQQLGDEHLLLNKSVQDDQMGFVITVPKQKGSELKTLSAKLGLSELKAPSYQKGLSLNESIREIEEKLKSIPQKLTQIDQDLLMLSNHNHARLKQHQNRLDDSIQAIQATHSIGQTKKTFMISGYCPKKEIKNLEQELTQHFGDKIHLETTSCEHSDELPPTLLDNPRLVRPFELFLKILSPPKYGSIDPTPFFAFFFPIFFGMIMGDMGYGLVFFGIGLTLRLKTKKILLKYIAEIILFCAFYTTLFGFIFAEFFGDWLEHAHILHPMTLRVGGYVLELNRMKDALIPLLIFTISIGVFHVTLGFLLKIFNSLRHKHHHEAIEIIFVLVSLASLFMLIGVLAQLVPGLFKIPSIIGLLIGIPIIVYMKGPMMLIELLSFVGNMLSYARIMAIGTASVYLAFVANELGRLTGSVIMGGIIVILFHIINMILAISPTIQSARLHYVEFFSKFYEPDGHNYNPLKKKGDYA